MRSSFLLTALLAGAALAFSAAPARAQVTINIGRSAPPPVVVREAHPVKYKAKHKYKKGHYYRPQPVLLVPARSGYYGPAGKHKGRGHGRH